MTYSYRSNDDFEYAQTLKSQAEPATETKSLSQSCRSRGAGLGRFIILFLGLSLAALPWTADYLLERYAMATTRGRLQAEYEFASNRIDRDNPVHVLSLGSQLVVQKIRPSVVSIQTLTREGVARNDSQGSGFIISEDGYIVTNQHVVDGADIIKVSMEGRRDVVAKVIGTDRFTDLAVIKINARGLVPIEWADSDNIQIGAMVWAIGSPYGLQNSVSQGIVSGMHRRDQQGSSYQEFLQTDAAVNPGNSGGPLVDGNGRVLGVNTLIFGTRFQGISFAVPSNLAREVCQVLQDKGRVDRGFLGVIPQPVYEDDINRLGLPEAIGALLGEVERNTPADRAGLQPNDVILSWNGKTVYNHNMLYRYIGLTPPNTTAEVRYVRNGVEELVNITVIELPPR